MTVALKALNIHRSAGFFPVPRSMFRYDLIGGPKAHWQIAPRLLRAVNAKPGARDDLDQRETPPHTRVGGHAAISSERAASRISVTRGDPVAEHRAPARGSSMENSPRPAYLAPVTRTLPSIPPIAPQAEQPPRVPGSRNISEISFTESTVAAGNVPETEKADRPGHIDPAIPAISGRIERTGGDEVSKSAKYTARDAVDPVIPPSGAAPVIPPSEARPVVPPSEARPVVPQSGASPVRWNSSEPVPETFRSIRSRDNNRPVFAPAAAPEQELPEPNGDGRIVGDAQAEETRQTPYAPVFSSSAAKVTSRGDDDPGSGADPASIGSNDHSGGQESVVGGELWLDTLSLRDWLREYLASEIGQATMGSSRGQIASAHL